MANIRTALKLFIKQPRIFFEVLFNRFNMKGMFCWLSDETFLRIEYFLHFGKKLNLKNPKSFNEKLNWSKLYNRKPEYSMMVDKYAVKEYVSGLIGSEYVIPTIGVWNSPEDIDWNSLPEKFVLKTTHGGGSNGVVICNNKNVFNIDLAKQRLNEGMKMDIYKIWREWPYKNVPKRIIAESYIEPHNEKKDLPDYKFFCFDGEVKALFVATERQTPNERLRFDFFDSDFNPLPFRQGHDHANVLPQKPKHFELMKSIASSLSKGIPHVRVDLYENEDKVYFGELTFFHFAGMVPFEPEEWDYKFGEWLDLPKKSN